VGQIGVFDSSKAITRKMKIGDFRRNTFQTAPLSLNRSLHSAFGSGRDDGVWDPDSSRDDGAPSPGFSWGDICEGQISGPSRRYRDRMP
jgi:hypothetical protein